MKIRISDQIVFFFICVIMGVLVIGSVVCSDIGEFNLGSDIVICTFVLVFEGLEVLGDDYVYEGWVVVDGFLVLMGIFEVDENGVFMFNEFVFFVGIVDVVSFFVFIIEFVVGDDFVLSYVYVLGGIF